MARQYQNYQSKFEEVPHITLLTSKEDYLDQDCDPKTFKFKCQNGHICILSVTSLKNKFRKYSKDIESNPDTLFCGECLKEKPHEETNKKLIKLFEDNELFVTSIEKGTVYYVCICGEEGSTHRGNVGRGAFKFRCVKCATEDRRVDYDEMKEYFEEQKCKLLTQKDEYKNNSGELKYICSCGNTWESSWKVFRRGGRCIDCANEKRQKTCLEKYGETNVSKLQETKKKAQETYLKKTGYDHPSKDPAVQKKRETTMMNNLGYKWAFDTPEVREKICEINMKKYGVRYPLESKEIQKKCDKAFIKKYGVKRPFLSKKFWEGWKKRNLATFGKEFHTQTKEYREKMEATMMRLYGVKHALQCYELYRKAMRTSFSTKKYEMPSGNIIDVMGYEGRCVDILLGKKKMKGFKIYHEEDLFFNEDLPVIDYVFDNVHRKYYPDMMILNKEERTIIEVKSTFTFNVHAEQNHAKSLAASKIAKIQTWIFDEKRLKTIVTYNQNGKATLHNGDEYNGQKIKFNKEDYILSEDDYYALLKDSFIEYEQKVVDETLSDI